MLKAKRKRGQGETDRQRQTESRLKWQRQLGVQTVRGWKVEGKEGAGQCSNLNTTSRSKWGVCVLDQIDVYGDVSLHTLVSVFVQSPLNDYYGSSLRTGCHYTSDLSILLAKERKTYPPLSLIPPNCALTSWEYTLTHPQWATNTKEQMMD